MSNLDVSVKEELAFGGFHTHVFSIQHEEATIPSYFSVPSLLPEQHTQKIREPVKPGAVKEVSKQLAELERVSGVHEVHGSEDLIVKVGAKNLDGLRSVILKVRGIPDVVETEFIPVFKTWKG